MADHTSAKKAIRQTARRTEINKGRVSRIRGFIKKVENLIGAGNKAEASVALRTAESELMRGVTKGVFHKNTASRKISRLSKGVKALKA